MIRLATALPGRGLLVLALLGGLAGPAAAEAQGEKGAPADPVAQLLVAAAPEVRAALEGAEASPARAALATLLARASVGREPLAATLGHPRFAPYARATFVALAAIDHLPGAVATFERLARDKKDAGIRGASFELEVAAALVERVASVGGFVDGHEVDLVLKDGTIVEVKNDAPDDEPTLSRNLASKAKAQLELRSKYGDMVMLVGNEPLSPAQADDFRRRLGPTAQVLVLDGGVLTTQLTRQPESPAQRLRRRALARLRPVAMITRVRHPSSARPRAHEPSARAAGAARHRSPAKAPHRAR
jgi:hypothetical protein